MYTHTCTFINIYFDIYIFLCSLIRSVLFFGFSKSCWSPVAGSGCSSLRRNYLINRWQEHPSIIAPPYTNSLTVSQGQKWEGTVPHGTSDRFGHLLCEKKARSDSKSLLSTAVKTGLKSGNERETTGLHPDLPHYRPYKEQPRWNT